MDSKTFNDFSNLPGQPEGESYVYFNPDYSREAMGQLTYLRYGDPAICPDSDEFLGDGNHVGPQVVSRIYTLFNFLSERLPKEGRNESFGGVVADWESPNGTLSDYGFLTSFHSDAVSKEVDYGVLLPPDYYLEHAKDYRYPVLYFFHGQGQDAAGMTATGLLLIGSMYGSARPDRIEQGVTDFQRAIIIWVDGECNGDECWTGTFYADFEGLPRDDRRYEQSFVELMKHVDNTYRTLPPRMVRIKK